MEGKIIANLNYDGSFAQRNMRFSSDVAVVANEKNELFNAMSLYLPKALADMNIVDFADIADEVSGNTPVVLTADVTTYTKLMKGSLLDQWIDAFNSDSNVDLVVYIIIFDDSLTSTQLHVTAKSIVYDPLTEIFGKLYFISYVKMLYDETYDGKDIVIPYPGTKGSMTVTIHNPTYALATLPAGTYDYTDAGKTYTFDVLADIELAAGASLTGVVLKATTVGVDGTLATGLLTNADFTPALTGTADLLTFTATAVTPGTNADLAPAAVPSKYFDLALCLAYQCNLNIKLSMFWSLVRVVLSSSGFPVTTSVDPNPCKIRSLTSAQEKAQMTALNMAATGPLPKPRTQLYWGALYLMNCQAAWVVAHSEPVNVLTEVLSAWFASRGVTGLYVGNKLSLLRLSGSKIKPFGYPSWLNEEVNVNDPAGFVILDAKNVGYLQSIADNSPQESSVASARGVTGKPVAALMISKYIDYTSAQDAAKMITDKGTLTNPVLTNEAAYKQIQEIVKNNMLLFSGTQGRLTQPTLKFPAFAAAKTSARALEAASAWSAVYVDDLDTVVVSGGITA